MPAFDAVTNENFKIEHPSKSTSVQNMHIAHVYIADCKQIIVMNVKVEVH